MLSRLSKLFGIRETLTAANIPTPSLLMAHMLVMRIASLPADDKYVQREMYLELPIKSGASQIELRCDVLVTPRTVTVGMPGSPAYKSVKLNYEEQQLVGNELNALYWRSASARALRLEAESQHNALSILEELL